MAGVRGWRLVCVVGIVGSCVTAAGCVGTLPPRESALRTSRLEAELLALPGAIAPDDAARLAAGAVAATRDLHARYRPLSPPHLGNLAFHLGLRERALCCHWAEDLLRALTALELPSVDLHWAVSHYGNVWREHSVVVAVPDGGAFETGLVLDAWRDSGRLHFVRVDRDRYPWTPHPSDALRHQLACGAGG